MKRLAIPCVMSCVWWACGGSPTASTPEHPEPAAPRAPTTPSAPTTPNPAPLSTRLGAMCDASTPCDDSTRCVHFCGGAQVAAENCDEPSPHGFCADSAELRSLPLRELALVFVAEGVHIPIAQLREMDDSRVLRIGSEAVVAGYRAAPVDVEQRNRRFDVMGASGRVCSAVAEGSWIVGLEPRETWDGADEPSVGDAMPSDHMHYAQQNGAVYRTLRLEPEGDCTGALWVRDASLPPIEYAAAGEREPTSEELAAYRALSVYSMMQRDVFHVYDPERTGEWTAGGEGRGFGPLAWDTLVSGSARVVISTHAGDICWGFEGTLMTVFRANGAVESVAWRTRGALQPSVALDVDGDGRLELIEHSGLEARIFSPTVKTQTQFSAAEATTGC